MAIDESIAAIDGEDAEYFASRLEPTDFYRIALEWPEKVLFLDIESTGLSRWYDDITLVGWSIGDLYGISVRGGSWSAFAEAARSAKAVVTFNGALFDLPFIRAKIEGVELPRAHIDLRFFGKRVGMSGTLKEVEAALGIARESDIQHMRGDAAPLLWYQYRDGDVRAMDTLIQYNHADVVGLRLILSEAVHRIVSREGVSGDDDSAVRWSRPLALHMDGSTGVRRAFPRAPEPVRPRILRRDLEAIGVGADCRVVGIDLTGSAERPSGWALVQGCRADTRRIGSDEELMDATIRASPTLVSIDSPLSLPTGRRVVTDDDPGRAEFGIMRACERELKRRGVNVYPSLIRSMQRLTERGMRLATALRAKGVPVIESYPGAAQDILCIPRKRSSLEYLRRGLRAFGLDWDERDGEVSHDELDAITSAIVGLFHWSGRYEALGTEDEGYLIVPQLQDETRWSRAVVGFSGRSGHGKTTAARLLEERGLSYGRISMVLRDLIVQRGKEPTRAELQNVGLEVHRTLGQRWLCQQLLDKLPSGVDLVIDGLRHPDDHAFFVETFGPRFIHIHLTVPEGLARQRRVERGDVNILAAESHPVESGVAALAQLAHVVLTNEGDMPSLERGVLAAVDRVRSAGHGESQRNLVLVKSGSSQ
jgi:predicted nuclease with RNAse H fold/dephospho-CoA kinase